MPIYEFGIADQEDQNTALHLPDNVVQVGPSEIPAYRQLEDVIPDILSGKIDKTPYRIDEFIIPGFRALDAGMKQYFSGIRIPTKDSYRFMRIKIAGGDRSFMIWHDDVVGGRARLPLAAIDRTNHTFNEKKFSPPKLPMALRYLGRGGNLAAKVFRPVPYLVDYKMMIWGERKRDVEYSAYQILTRFNPLAEFRMFDGKLQGTVTIHFDGCNDASDKEVGHNQAANVRYEISMRAEAWLPLPEVIVPVVLKRVTTIQERVGRVLLADTDNMTWVEPRS